MADSFGTAPVGSAVRPCPLAKKEQPEHWIEIELIGEDDQPILWEHYRVVLPSGETVEGLLDDRGQVRIDHLPSGGECQVSFPDLDKDAFEFVRATSARQSKDGM